MTRLLQASLLNDGLCVGETMRSMIDHNDSYSYEDWMNDMATREPRNKRGWMAQYQTRCDCCGRFVRPGTPGGSWVMVPCSDVSMGDERERCPDCTEKYGQAHCGPAYVEHLCCGMNPTHNAEVSGRPHRGTEKE